MEFLRRRLGLIIRLVVTVAILAFVFAKIPIEQTLDTIVNMNPWWVLAAWALFGPMLFITAWRWQLLLKVPNIHLPLGQIFQLNLVGQFFNAFMLGSTGGDVVKIYYAAKSAPTKRSAAGLTVILDRVIGMLVLVVIAVFFCLAEWDFLTTDPHADLASMDLPSWVTPALAVYATLAIAAAAVGFIGASLYLPRIKAWAKAAGLWERLPLHGTLERLFDAYQLYHTAYGTLVAVTVISIANHAINILLGYCLILALGLQPSLWQVASFLPMVFLLIAIPVSIGGFGVREVLCVLFFALFGYSNEQGLAFSLVYWLVLTAWSVVGGIFYLRYETPTHILEATEAMDKPAGS